MSATLFLFVTVIGGYLILGQTVKKFISRERRSLKAIEFDELLNSNYRFVLYLRSFNDDGKNTNFGYHPWDFYKTMSATYESEIAKNFKEKCFIAVGKPNEEFPEIGALSLYLDETWKEKVAILMEKATLIILKPSDTLGLRWELETAINNGYLNKIIIPHRFSLLKDSELNEFYYKKFKKDLKKDFNIDLLNFHKKMKYSIFKDGKNKHLDSLKPFIQEHSLPDYDLKKYRSDKPKKLPKKNSNGKGIFDAFLQDILLPLLVIFFIIILIYKLAGN